MKARVIRYLSAAVFCALLVWLYVSGRDPWTLPLVEQYRIWCDAFTIPGLLLVLAGCLVWISNKGALDGISYAVRGLFRVFIPGAGLRQNMESYYDYLKRKEEKRIKGYGFLFAVGGVCLAAAAVFMILFYRLYEPRQFSL